MKILVSIGTRPEAIKMAPVIMLLKEIQSTEIIIDLKVCLTGQHRQMLDQALDIFNLAADYDLNVMADCQDLTDITVKILTGMRDVLKEVKPDLLLVHGDTTTAAASALAAFYAKVPVAHVEAGLRSGNIYSPWPEEVNRKIIGTIACRHFAPTANAAQNLLRENIDQASIEITGNTVIDSLFYIINYLNRNNKVKECLSLKYSFLNSNRRMLLVTGHRRENFGKGFENICHALKVLSMRNDIEIVYPVHLNPNVQEPVSRLLNSSARIHLIEPVDYIEFVYLMSMSYMVLTDSGGVQEEAPSLGKPVLVMRNTTERPEGLSAGAVKLVGTMAMDIVESVQSLLDDSSQYEKMASAVNPYGDGTAANKIVNYILSEANKFNLKCFQN